MIDETFHLTPLDVPADRVVKDGAQKAFVFAAHGSEARGRSETRVA